MLSLSLKKKKNWLSNKKLRVVINGTASDWAPVISGVPQGSALGPVMFINCINDIDVGLNNCISKCVDTKIGNSIIADHDRISLPEDLRKITEWSQRWEIPFNVNKCHILQVATRNFLNMKKEMNGTKLESVQCVKNLGVTVASILKFSPKWKDAAGKAKRMLGFINRNLSFKTKDGIPPLYITLVRPHLENAGQFWMPHHAKDIAKREAVQRRATKMIISLGNKPYKERLARLNLFSRETSAPRKTY